LKHKQSLHKTISTLWCKKHTTLSIISDNLVKN